MEYITLILFLASCFFLVASGGWLIKLLTKIASYFRLSEFVVAFIIMAFSTSLPELFVGIDSAISGRPSLALGTVIGSNIVDLTLVIGIAALLGRGIKIKSKYIKEDSIFMFLLALAPIILMLDKTLSWIDGLVLVAIFIIYSRYLIKERRAFKKEFDKKNKNYIVITTIFFVLSLGVLFLSAHFVVKYAIQLAGELVLPPLLIGLFLVAIGTSLPELVFESRAVLAKKSELAVGDMMGSVVCNSTLVLGVTAILSPITTVSFSLFLTSAVFMLIVAFLFMLLIRRKKGLSVTMAILLILLYIFFILFEFVK